MEFLKNVYERRKKYFENLDRYLEEVKKIVNELSHQAEVYLYGSVVEGDYSIGLSDIDVAIVSEEFRSRERKLEVFDRLLKEFFDSPVEFHILSPEQWGFYKRFVKRFRRV